ncbi:hypothetical protein BG000_005639 [Podila horticola]|nr:hypothetical protein BG000_005639 [Podila horticola]
MDGPHVTIEAAKCAFRVIYKERFDLEWVTRETTVSERWTYEVKTYETFEETEYIEEVVEDSEVKGVIALEQQVIDEGKFVSTEQSMSSSHDDTDVPTVNEQAVSQVDSDKSSDSGSRGDESCASSKVLVLGKTQAGKSTFIEFVKNYANQQYTINERLLGTGFQSKTRMPEPFMVMTDLPAYEVFDATGTRIDIGSLADQHQDPEDYFDALNDRKTALKLVSHDLASSLLPRHFEIVFLDTPGVEDTNGRDSEHAERIIDAMTKMQSFNLIIIIINCEETPSKAHQLAFNYYAKVIHTFQGHHSNIVFLYTHVEYEKCHHSNTDHLSVMERRHKVFSQLFRCQGSYNHEDVCKDAVEPYPMYNIDFDKRQRPVTKCMRLMTLREILTHVVNSPAVSLDTSASNLQRIQAITHPDEPNQAQRKKVLDMTRVMVEQGQGPQDDIIESMVPRGCPIPLEVNSSGICNQDRAIDPVDYGSDDCKHYFPTTSDYSGSEEEDDDRSDVLDSGISMGHTYEVAL